MTLEALKTAASQLSQDDRLELLTLLEDSIGLLPSVRHSPGVCGGSACLGRTRLAIWMIEQYRRDGCGVVKILQLYPWLTEAEVKWAFEYADTHREEIERDIREDAAIDDIPEEELNPPRNDAQ